MAPRHTLSEAGCFAGHALYPTLVNLHSMSCSNHLESSGLLTYGERKNETNDRILMTFPCRSITALRGIPLSAQRRGRNGDLSWTTITPVF